eukprot:COSAG02_NODE_418_length_22698_cov_7.471127_3_plen_80_part_00
MYSTENRPGILQLYCTVYTVLCRAEPGMIGQLNTIVVVHVLYMYSTVQLLHGENDWNPFSNSTETLSIRIATFLLVYRV